MIVSQIRKSTIAQEAELKEQLTQHAARMTEIEAERAEITRLRKSTLAQESDLRYQLAQHSARLKFGNVSEEISFCTMNLPLKVLLLKFVTF